MPLEVTPCSARYAGRIKGLGKGCLSNMLDMVEFCSAVNCLDLDSRDFLVDINSMLLMPSKQDL